MDDPALVEAAREGDEAAWAAIYDRYADRLHDHCHRILRDRDEAADALHDAFIAASTHLDQLRDPSRLRPWLYSICRHEALRRARQRSRVELTDEVDQVSSVEVDLDRGRHSEELQELVWAAAAGLNPRDQALLDLNLRQGLDGQDLADAMGTSLNSSYVMLSRLRDQVERSLGALLIARLGRDDCPDLDAVLEGWDGRFSPLLRKRVARHVDRCDICQSRRAAVVSPLALLAATPLVPAPAALRARVLDGSGAGGPTHSIRFTRGGFAGPAGPRGGRGSWLAAAAAVVLAVSLVVGLLALVGDGGGEAPVALVEDATTTTEAPSTTAARGPSITASIEPGATTTVPQVSPPTDPAHAPLSTDGPVVIGPTGPPDTTPPVIGQLRSEHVEIGVESAACTPAFPTTSQISALVSGATSAVLSWSGPPLSGEVPMDHGGDVWTATLGPFSEPPADLLLHYTLTVADGAGNTAARTGSLMVTC